MTYQAIEQAAAAKGLRAFITNNPGFIRGSNYDTVVLVSGNTFACKEVLKAHGAQWVGREKSWCFKGTEAAAAAFAAI